MKGRGGFTLLELLIVITIIGVLVALALPRYAGLREKVRSRQALDIINILKGDLEAQYAAYDTYNAANLHPSVGTYSVVGVVGEVDGATANDLWDWHVYNNADPGYTINANRIGLDANNLIQYFSNQIFNGNHSGTP